METIETKLLRAAEFIIGYLDARADIDEDIAARMRQLKEALTEEKINPKYDYDDYPEGHFG